MVKDIFIEENINKRKRNVVQIANNSITLFDTYWILGLWKLVGRKKRSILIKIAQNRRQKVKSLHSEAVTQKCSVKKCVFRNFAKFTGKRLCQSLFFNKVASGTGVSCGFREIFKNTLFTEHLR